MADIPYLGLSVRSSIDIHVHVLCLGRGPHLITCVTPCDLGYHGDQRDYTD